MAAKKAAAPAAPEKVEAAAVEETVEAEATNEPEGPAGLYATGNPWDRVYGPGEQPPPRPGH